MAALLLAAALALLLGPGSVVCAAAGVRWRTAIAAGPALTVAVVAVGVLATDVTGLRWGPVSAGVTAFVAIVLAAVLGVATRIAEQRGWGATPGGGDRRDDRRPGRRRGPGVGDLVVALLSTVPAVQVAVATRGFTAIPQNWDAIFHGAATRFIAETGRAGPAELGQVSQPANPAYYYPDAYHALASLLVGLPGGPPPGALDALSAVTGTVFVLGSAALAGRLCGGSRLAAVAAAGAAVCTWMFPYSVLGHGPLLPFALGVAVIPGLLLLGEQLSARSARPVQYALLLGAGMVGAWAVHPSVALAAALPLVTQAVAGTLAAPGLRPRLTVVGYFLLAALPGAAYAGWTTTIISEATTNALAGFSWPREGGVLRAVLGVLDLGPTAVASIGLATAVLLGLASIALRRDWRRPLTAPVVALLGFGSLYVLATAVQGDWVRTITGFWWDDATRFAALLVVPAVVLVGAGVRATVPRGSVRRPAARASVSVVVALGLLAASGQAVVARDLTALGYGDGPAVSDSERTVLDALATRYDGGVVLNDPFDGTSWVYALHAIPVVFPAPLADAPEQQLGRDRMYLYTSANRYGFDPVVTQIVSELDVRWVVVGTGVVGGPGRPGGFIGLRFNPHLRLVEESPGARVYEVFPVAPGHPPFAPPPGIPPVVPAVQPPNTDSPLVGAAPEGAGTSLDGAAGK